MWCKEVQETLCRMWCKEVQEVQNVVQGGAGRCRKSAPSQASCLVQGGAGGAGTPQTDSELNQ
jgi:hypothetical protein